MPLTTRGVALAEAIVAAALGVAVLALALRTLVVLQRVVAGQQERHEARATLLDAVHLLRAELGDIDPAAGDLLIAEPARMVFRAVRGSGVVCAVVPDGPVVASAAFRALRLPSSGRDSLLVLPADAPDGWLRRPVTGPPRAADCPGGRSGLAIPAPGLSAPLAGAFLRLFEVVELRFYASGGEWWLGFRSVTGGETTQPVAGPFIPGGFRFAYVGAGGEPTGDRQAVRSITLFAVARAELRPEARDSLTVTIPLAGAGTP